jgi:hypothetical protein
MFTLLCLTPIMRHLRPVALWPDRSADLQSTVQLMGPFTAAAAAWTASREHRRGMADLLACTPLGPWRRWTATWAGTAGWAVLFYFAFGAAFFAITTVQVTWGHLIVWPVLSGLTSLIACSVVGFAAGRLMPVRFVAPLTAVGVYLVMVAGREAAGNGVTPGLLSPIYPSISLGSSVFYAIRPGLTYVQVACYLGVAVAALGLIVLRGHAGDRAVRRGGAALTVGGLALVAVAFGVVSTSHRDGQGIVVPLLHDASTDRAIPYTPVCVHDGTLPVCLHPAYANANELAAFDATVNKIVAPLAGTPGLPIRAEQLPGEDDGTPGAGLRGDPPVLVLPHFIIHGNTIEPPGLAAAFQTRIALTLVTQPSPAVDRVTPAQRAVALYLLRQAGYTAWPGFIPDDAAVSSAARRLGALSATARHVPALRAGTLTLTELP